MPRLLIVRGSNSGVGYELGEHTRIGRLGENEIQVSDPNVSRLHAEILHSGDDYVIFDRGSKNGVLINGQETAEKNLVPGDEIVIGGSVFLFEAAFTVKNAKFSENYVIVAAAPVGEAEFANCKVLDRNVCSASKLAMDIIEPLLKCDVGRLPELSGSLVDAILAHFHAKNVVLFLRDYVGGEFNVTDVAPRDTPTIMFAELLERCEAERSTISVCHPAPAISGLGDDESDPNGNQPGKGGENFVAMLAPLEFNDEVMGVVAVTGAGNEPFSDDAICELDGVAKLVGHCLKSAANIEHARRTVKESEYLDPESRSASSRSLRMQEIYNSARRSADGDGIILITGEKGTGKETLARFVHESGPRASGPFVVFNCATVPPEDFERQLFGAEKDLSEDSDQKDTYVGRVEEAQGGALLLSEIGELDLTLQPKLLRFLQDHAFYRVGGKKAHNADVRVIASTSIDLAAAVRAGKFREDLWYRLNVVPFNMPPLRERREDIGPLVDFFMARHSVRLNRKVIGINDAAISLLQKYDWPGNIRELDNAVERAVLLCESKVLATTDFSHIEVARRRLNSQADLERKRDTKPLAEVERQHILIALKKYNFNQARAAEALGLHRNTLRNKIIEYGIEITK